MILVTTMAPAVTSLAEGIRTSSAALWENNFGYGAVPIVLVIVLVTEVVWYVQAQAQRRRSLPPGPRPWPVLGNLDALGGDNPHRALQKLSSKFGPLMYLQLGSVPSVVASTAGAVRELFRNNDESLLARSKMLSFGIRSGDYKTMGFLPPGKLWHSLRKLGSNELFSAKRNASYQNSREEEVRHMMDILVEESKSGEPVDLRSWLHELSANIMTRMLVNKRFFAIRGANVQQENLKDDLDKYLLGNKQNLMPIFISDFVPCFRFYLETLQGRRAEMEALLDRAITLGGKIFELQKHRQRASEAQKDEEYVPDFVDVMCTAPLEDGKVWPDTLIIIQLFDFFLGGTDSSTSVVEWAMAELIKHPDLMERVQQELTTTVPSPRLVHESDIPHLPFLQAVVKESFRMHPPAPIGLPRESTQPVQALGYHIPAKTRIILNVHAIHRDPAVYEKPDEFRPDRFLDRNAHANQLAAFDSYELIPFGVGRRMCPAYNLGNSIVHLMLANLVHAFQWRLPDGERAEGLDLTEKVSGVSFRPPQPLRLVPMPRTMVLA